MKRKPVIALITTGGTIAGTAPSARDTTGYAAGALDGEQLLASVPGLGHLAELRIDTLFALDSKDMTPAHWLQLHRAVAARLREEEIAGVVITHGTDTLEETAYFLDLCLDLAKPVIFTAAMRPATALSADGPMNLAQAVATACCPKLAKAGVLAVMNDRVHRAAALHKQHPTHLDAFHSPCAADVAAVLRTGRLSPTYPRSAALTIAPATATLPTVELLYVCAGSSPALLQSVLAAGAAGVVLALPGNLGLPATWGRMLQHEVPPDFPVVLTSRCGAGSHGVTAELPPGVQLTSLDPIKARVRLIAGLGAGLTGAELRDWYDRAGAAAAAPLLPAHS